LLKLKHVFDGFVFWIAVITSWVVVSKVKSLCNNVGWSCREEEDGRWRDKIKILINKINGKKEEPVANYTN
jgi:hypothetical protein